jgi:carbamate kinase
MKRIVIAIGGNYPDQHKKSVYLNSIEKIFTEMGKMIAENDVVITYSGSCNENKPSPTAIMNSYDHVKYTYGYSKDIISLLTRIEVKSYHDSWNDSATKDKLINGNIQEEELGNLKIEKCLEPLDIPEKSAIMTLLSDGYLPLVIGAGFPVIKELQYYKECRGIVNNYSSSSLLGTLIEADEFIIISECSSYSGSISVTDSYCLKSIRFHNLMAMYKNGRFTESEMDSKIKPMLDFISKGGKKAILMTLNMNTEIVVTL